MLTDEQKQEWRERIVTMSQTEMARLQRFAPSGHVVFDRRNGLCDFFHNRFKMLGGMTPQVSKAIGR